MANNCDALLAANIGRNCDNPQVGGLEEYGVIINKADIDYDKCTKDATNPNLLTSLALKSGKKGFSIYQYGNHPFNGTNTTFNAGEYLSKFTKQVSFVVFDHSANTSHKIIDQLANGSYVVVLRNQYNGGDNQSKFEVYGFEYGMKMTEGNRDPYSEDVNGAWMVSMQEVAPSSGMFLFKESLAATETLVNSLTASAS